VARLEVFLPESGAIATISLCRDPGAPTPTPSPTPSPTATPALPAVVSFSLIDADTDAPVTGFDPIPAGATINLAALPGADLNIRANLNAEPAESVRFDLTGSETYSRIENVAPYALKGDTNGDYDEWQPSLGTYTLTAVPYTQDSASGTAGVGHTLTFTVIDEPVVTSFTLFDAETDTPIAGFDPLADGTTVNLAALPTTQLNIRANVAGAESVFFNLSGAETYSRIENVAPYALKGDTNGNYDEWQPSLGTYTLTAVPYTEDSAGVTAGIGLTITFTIIDDP